MSQVSLQVVYYRTFPIGHVRHYTALWVQVKQLLSQIRHSKREGCPKKPVGHVVEQFCVVLLR
jgi:hypothetical protein